MASWNECKTLGDTLENLSMKDIKEKTGYDCEKNIEPANYKYYDYTVLNIKKTIECKFDYKGSETKNVCIETHCEGKESGISVTTADFWIISDGVVEYFILTDEIKRCIKEGYTSLYPEEPTKFLHWKKCPVPQDDDGSVKLMDFYTIPSWLFSTYCIEVNIISNMTYKGLK